jgi:hypothetical protein
VKGFKAQHRTRQPFDAAVILLYDIVQVFTLTDLDACMMIAIHLFQARVIGPTLINIDQTRFAVFIDRFLQKA